MRPEGEQRKKPIFKRAWERITGRSKKNPEAQSTLVQRIAPRDETKRNEPLPQVKQPESQRREEDKTNREETEDYTTEIIQKCILHISDTEYKISAHGGGSRFSRLNISNIRRVTAERSLLGPRVEILFENPTGITELDSLETFLSKDFIFCKSYQQALEVAVEIGRRKLQQKTGSQQKKTLPTWWQNTTFDDLM